MKNMSGMKFYFHFSICDIMIYNNKYIYFVFVPGPGTDLLKPLAFPSEESSKDIFVM